MIIIPFKTLEEEKRRDFFLKHWGGTEMIISTGHYDCLSLDGFVCMEGHLIKGVLTFIEKGRKVEVVSLDAVEKGKGIGTLLIKELEKAVMGEEVSSIELITTNDNMDALAFYQKKGFRIVKIIPDAVAGARKQKPSIPHYASNGIPIMDEILLRKDICG
ncbi:GNAT family N-acetyltransferase [Rossellomorea aquimaris]|uniref:GNAT family N-acetyltransferase n=1 Tax=Rossellomorea aquimaris TaxID=189382 RepID=UPI001CD5A4DB|nr:GNAT family N-acetyltransferase [Rossellomorea aquimaris]MCA1053820.1 GNAT family N-acetyltransferase [Rossellomorea aquimaris]